MEVGYLRLGNKIQKIIKINSENYSVKLKFVDGAIMTIPMEHIFARPKGLAAEVLRGGMFEKCFLESGALAWPNGLEFCPDAMRTWAIEKSTSSSLNEGDQVTLHVTGGNASSS